MPGDRPWGGSSITEGDHKTRTQAWLAYQLWLGDVFKVHHDAGLQASVKITKQPDGRWRLCAEVRPCSEG